MWQGIDKRKFPRADYPCKVVVIKKGQTEKISTRTENIGKGGICALMKKELDKFVTVELVLYLEDGRPPIECDARVVWVVKRKNEFDTGIEFLNLKQKDAERIERIIQECLKNQGTSSQEQ